MRRLRCASEQTNTQIYRHANCNTSHPYRKQSNNMLLFYAKSISSYHQKDKHCVTYCLRNSLWHQLSKSLGSIITPTHAPCIHRRLAARSSRQNAQNRCSLSVGVCVCVLGTQVSCTNAAELVEMPFWGLTHVDPNNHYYMEVKIPYGKQHFSGGGACNHCYTMVTFLMHLNVPAQRTRRTNAFAAARGDKTAMRPFVKLI